MRGTGPTTDGLGTSRTGHGPDRVLKLNEGREAPSLRRRGWDELADHAEAIPRSQKAEVLLGLLHRHLGRGEKVLVFTGFQRTLETAATTPAEAGIPAAVYSGSLSRQEEEDALRRFARTFR